MSGRGVAALLTSHKQDGQGPPGPPFQVGSAYNGLSVDPAGKIVLGQDKGQVGNPAVVFSDRQVPLVDHSIFFTTTLSGSVVVGGSLMTNPHLAKFVVDKRDQAFNIGFEILQDFVGANTAMRIDTPVAFAGDVPYDWLQDCVPNGDGTFNTIMKWGFNPDKQARPAQTGMWLAMEPNFLSGGNRFREFHYEISIAGGGNSRLFSSTFVEGATLALSQNTWDFRANVFNFQTVVSGSMVAISQAGGVTKMQISGLNPFLEISDSGLGTIVDISNTNGSLIFTGAGSSFNGQSAGVNINIPTPASAGNGVLQFTRFGGGGLLLALAGPTVGGGLANDLYLFDSNSGKIPLDVKANGHIIINTTAGADNGAIFQIEGNFTTGDPNGAGTRGKILLGKVIAAAVAFDATNYWEVNIEGVVKKVALAV